MDPIANNDNDNNGQQDNHDDPQQVQPENLIPEDLVDHPAIQALLATNNANFIVTNPRLPGNPIIYANPGFLQLTGYSIVRVLGRNCRFLQGPETDPVAVARMREAVDNRRDVYVTLLNYRRDGSTFWNRILISGIRDARDEVTYFLGAQILVPPPDQEGEVHKPSMCVG